MPQLFRTISRREFFNPSLIGIFTNPFFFIKRGIYRGIKANASYMKGIMLDFGCGPKPYECLFSVDKYVGLEFGESSHDHRDSQIDVLYDGRRIPFADVTFDSVLAVEVFEHVLDLEEILRELHRVMKPNGHMLITMPFAWEEHETPHDYRRYTSYGIATLLNKQGFEVIDINKSSNYVETCFQIWSAYASQRILPRNRILKPLLFVLVISPLTLLGIILARLLPKDKALYLNSIIVARKGQFSRT